MQIENAQTLEDLPIDVALDRAQAARLTFGYSAATARRQEEKGLFPQPDGMAGSKPRWTVGYLKKNREEIMQMSATLYQKHRTQRREQGRKAAMVRHYGKTASA